MRMNHGAATAEKTSGPRGWPRARMRDRSRRVAAERGTAEAGRTTPMGPLQKNASATGAEKEVERRLLEVLDAVERRRDEVAGAGHLARDLGVAAVVGLVERMDRDPAEEEERGERGRQDESRAGHGRPFYWSGAAFGMFP